MEKELELTDEDIDHIAEQLKQGFTEGQIVHENASGWWKLEKAIWKN